MTLTRLLPAETSVNTRVSASLIVRPPPTVPVTSSTLVTRLALPSDRMSSRRAIRRDGPRITLPAPFCTSAMVFTAETGPLSSMSPLRATSRISTLEGSLDVSSTRTEFPIVSEFASSEIDPNAVLIGALRIILPSSEETITSPALASEALNTMLLTALNSSVREEADTASTEKLPSPPRAPSLICTSKGNGVASGLPLRSAAVIRRLSMSVCSVTTLRAVEPPIEVLSYRLGRSLPRVIAIALPLIRPVLAPDTTAVVDMT